jgi:hypothetical protein
MTFSTDLKLRATIRSMIIFIIVSLPITYRTTNRLFGGIIGKLANESGCPTLLGLIIHTIVFGIIIYGLMHIKL